MTRLLLILSLGICFSSQAQPADTTSASVADTSSAPQQRDTDWLLLPFASYAPETKVSGGMSVGVYRPERPNRSASSVQAAITVTQERQLIAQVAPELYLDGGRWRVQGDLQATHYPSSFHGIGGDTPASAKEGFTSRYALIDATVQRRLRPNLRAGPRLLTRVGTITEPDSGGVIARDQVPGADGGVTAGIGGSVFWDARDNRYYPTTGSYAEFVATLHSAAWGSDYTFGQIKTDLRGYRTLGRGVLAGQVYSEATIGDAPFQLLPLLGGSNHMRGYRAGRLREALYWTVQAEYRVPLFWRFKGTAFASIGEVGPRVGAPLVKGVETAVGLGGRLRLTEDGVHGRVDLAYSRTGIELYLSLGEAF
jgi:hypothetical protein